MNAVASSLFNTRPLPRGEGQGEGGRLLMHSEPPYVGGCQLR